MKDEYRALAGQNTLNVTNTLIDAQGLVIRGNGSLNASYSLTTGNMITVKGDMEGVREALLAIDGVSDVAYDSSSLDKTPGAVQLTVTVTSSEDLRDAIFFAMAEKKYAVISMEQKEMSLESIFLSLTDDTNPATDGKKKKKKEVR